VLILDKLAPDAGRDFSLRKDTTESPPLKFPLSPGEGAPAGKRRKSIHRECIYNLITLRIYIFRRVRIVYTEPTFQMRLVSAADVYTIDSLVRDAASPEEAVQAAMREWHYCAANSRVSWGRFIPGALRRGQ
jgi:hypothetical protein